MTSPGERIFLWLVRLYPRAFRERYGDDLVAFFREDRVHPKYGSGALRPIRFWRSTLADLGRVAISERATMRPALPTVAALWFDVRTAIRSLRSSQAIAITALVLLTIGIGVSTAIFSAVDAIVLRSLPFDAPDRLVSVAETELETGNPVTVAPQNYLELVARQHVFDAMGGSMSAGSFTTVDTDRPQRIRAQRITASLFDVLGVAPAIGRNFTPAVEIEGNHRVVLISDALWRARFGADPGAIGRVMRFESGAYEVAGVMPKGFRYPVGTTYVSAVDLWVPFAPTARDRNRAGGRTYNMQAIGRLKPGSTIQQASAQMGQIRDTLAVDHPKWFVDRGIVVRPMHEAIVSRQVRSWMLMLLGAVAVVLLIACVNVANLLLARATGRSREIGVRAAMGATRGHIVRGLIAESLMLSLAGAAGGLLMAYWSVDFLKATLPDQLPRVWAIAVDLRVILIATGAAIISGLFCGLVPALQLSTGDVVDALRGDSRSTTASPGRERVRTAFLITEVALATILLVGAGLFVASLARITRIDLGFNPENVLTVLASNRIGSIERDPNARIRSQTLAMQSLDAVRGVAGVQSAALVAGGMPLSGSYMTHPVKVPGRAEAFAQEKESDLRAVTADYLATVGATLLSGRFIDERDTRGAPKVVVINEEAVRLYFGGRDPIGTVMELETERTVIGVVRSMRVHGPETDLRPEAYTPFLQSDQPGADLVVRTASEPMALSNAIKSAVWSVMPNAVIPEPETFATLYAELIATRKFNVILLGLFSGLAVLIASIGIYGVMSYVVEQRTREIGVRMALGAVPRRIMGMILGRATVTTAVGLALGFGAAIWLERLVTSFLFNPTPRDPTVYTASALTIMLVALVAVFVPARRASRVDPLVALRSE